MLKEAQDIGVPLKVNSTFRTGLFQWCELSSHKNVMHVCESEVAALVAAGELSVVDSQSRIPGEAIPCASEVLRENSKGACSAA